MVEEGQPCVSNAGNDVTFLQVIAFCGLRSFLLLPSSYKSAADQVEVMRAASSERLGCIQDGLFGPLKKIRIYRPLYNGSPTRVWFFSVIPQMFWDWD